jgi:hypothetical protein
MLDARVAGLTELNDFLLEHIDRGHDIGRQFLLVR